MKSTVKRKCDYLIVGAGLSGITLANLLATKGEEILLIEKKNHIGGACYDYLDGGIIVQKYGPHIFHTNNKKAWNYLSKFTEWIPYKHKVLAFYKNKYYPMPINLDTVNSFFNLSLKSGAEMKLFLKNKKKVIENIKNSEDLAMSEVGKELYGAFIKNFTKKTWGEWPEELDASVLKRISVKYDKNAYYFNQKYQGLPKSGYTTMFNKMLAKKNIAVLLNTDFSKEKNKIGYKKLIYTGKIDEFFNYKFGKLSFRKISFKIEKLNKISFQPNSVVNYTDNSFEFARITEFKKFHNTKSKKTIISKEKYDNAAEDFYPIANKKNFSILGRYLDESKKLKNVIFFGKMAEFKYSDMDDIVIESLKRCKNL
jgi:UDP-galactopyranose mutase